MKKIFFILLFFPVVVFSQEETDTIKVIEIIHSNVLKTTLEHGPDIKILIGEVELLHDSATMFCDSAYYNSILNEFIAFSNVHVIKLQPTDTVQMFGDLLHYYGADKKAEVRNNVILTKDSTTLYTDSLNFDLNTDVGYYFEGGRTENGEDTLISDYGYFYSRTDELFFKDSVKILNPDYSIFSDTLKHNLTKKISYFYGSTEIFSDSSYIYCEDGLFDHTNDWAEISKNAFVENKEYSMLADSIFYDRENEIGEGFQNVEIRDTINNVLLLGHYGIYEKQAKRSLMTDSAVFVQISDQQDSLFLHGDTLRVHVDTAYTEEDTISYRLIRAYHHVKMYKEDFQLKCDSLVYTMLDSVIELYYEPVLWSEENQLTARFMKINVVDNSPKRIDLIDSAFIVSQSDSIHFDQVKGKNMIGYFENSDLKRMRVLEETKVVYCLWEDSTLIAINKLECDSMKIMMQDSKVNKIFPYSKPKGVMYPPSKLSIDELYLSGFKWFEADRPKNRYEIFIWKKEIDIKND